MTLPYIQTTMQTVTTLLQRAMKQAPGCSNLRDEIEVLEEHSRLLTAKLNARIYDAAGMER